MRLNKFLFIGATCLSLIGLVGCSGSPTKTSYYLLASTPAQATESQVTESQATESQAEANRPLVIIKPVYVAEFLQQPGIIMQINQHQFQPARTHLWAESLDEGINKSLLQDLKVVNPDYTVRSEYRWLTGQARYQVQIKIDQFQVTDHSTVVISGSYWIIDAQTKNVFLNKDFSFQDELTENGYEHAVSKLRKLIYQLSLQLGESLNLLNQNVNIKKPG